MNLLFLLILTGFFAGCGTADKEPKLRSDFDESLLDHYYAFLVDANERGIDISEGDSVIVFKQTKIAASETGEKLAGTCTPVVYGTRGITPTNYEWKEINIATTNNPYSPHVFKTSYHEWGHCALGKNHYLKEDDSMEIMFTHNLGDSYQNKIRWKAMVDSFFANNP